MARRSNKSIAETLTPAATQVSASRNNDNDNDGLSLLERKINIATEGFTIHKFCELVLRDRNRLSKENALTICEYVIAMKREVNPRLSYKRYTIQFVSRVIKGCRRCNKVYRHDKR